MTVSKGSRSPLWRRHHRRSQARGRRSGAARGRRRPPTGRGGSGPAGIFTLACAALDVALWDIRGKALGLPLWKLLGGTRQRVATYASGALRRHLSLDEVVAAAGALRAKGFREVKMQLALPGETTPAKEVERAVKIREAL